MLLAYRYQLTRAQLGWRPDLPARRSFRQQRVQTAVLYTAAVPGAAGLMGWLQDAGVIEELVLVATLVTVLYEVDFRGFSYGFRPGRSPHRAGRWMACGDAWRG